MFAVKIVLKVPKRILYVQSVRKISVASDLVCQNLEGSDSGIAVFGLNRAKQKNALSGNLAKELKNALLKLHYESEAKVLVIRSLVPGVFCAGADLKERLAMPQNQVSKAVANLRSLTEQIHRLPIPVIAALDGLALGGGLEISLACDIRIAVDDVKLGLVETKLAIIPGAGGTQRLPRLINPSLAKELIYTARIIDGAAAHRLGLVNHVVQQNESGDAAYLKSLEIAREIVPNGPVAIQMAKRAIDRGLQVDLDTGLAIEEACYAQVVPTEDRVEGLKAFSEKRKPVYTGR